MFEDTPRLFVTLLAVVVASNLGVVMLSDGPLLPALLWPALFAALSLSALLGKQSAARALGYVLYIAGVLSLMLPLVAAQSVFGIATLLIWGVLAIGTARYIFKSEAVRRSMSHTKQRPRSQTANPFIERTSSSRLCLLSPAAHVRR